MRERLLEAVAERVRLGVGVAARLRLRLGVALSDGSAYLQLRPLTTGPVAAATCTKYLRAVATRLSVLARALAAQDAPATSPALSFSARQLKATAEFGQPVPMYSSVLLELRPQVESVRTEPRGTVSPSDKKYTSRGAVPRKAPVEPHKPLEYSPAQPAVSEEVAGEVPEVPDRTMTDEAGARHSGLLGVAVGVCAAVAEAVAAALSVRD